MEQCVPFEVITIIVLVQSRNNVCSIWNWNNRKSLQGWRLYYVLVNYFFATRVFWSCTTWSKTNMCFRSWTIVLDIWTWIHFTIKMEKIDKKRETQYTRFVSAHENIKGSERKQKEHRAGGERVADGPWRKEAKISPTGKRDEQSHFREGWMGVTRVNPGLTQFDASSHHSVSIPFPSQSI